MNPTRYKGAIASRQWRLRVDSVEMRIDRLERAIRAHRIVVAALVLAFAGAMMLEHRRVRVPQLETRGLSVVDSQGRTRIALGRFERDAFGLSLADAEGHPRALFELQGDGSPRLSFANPSGQSLAELTVFQDAPRMSLTNVDGVEFFSLSVEMDGSSRLSLLDQRGQSRINIGASGDGSPGLVLVDRYGRALAELTISADASKLVLQGRHGSVFRAPID